MNNKIYKCVYCGRNLGDKVPHRCKGTFRKRKLQFMDRVSGQLDAPVKHDFCDNTFRLNTTELNILIGVFEGATKNIDQYRVLNKLLKHKLRIVESISKNSV